LVRLLREDGADLGLDSLSLLERHGVTPLPPYVRKGRALEEDRQRYQTTYARHDGSVAAPTAGLHLSEALLHQLAARGVDSIDLTLHIGIGTFRPIQVEDLSDHVMHAEWAELSLQAASALQAHRDRGGRIVAVGTTSVRTLETAAAGGTIEPFRGQTDLFIRPGHVFHAVDALLTNFHLPRSSLLVLVSALAGVELIREAYRQAVYHGYRFFSYGDAMLIL
jgi:S-adenosylmethionine:tRNA ribosyltransferase-isomerase